MYTYLRTKMEVAKQDRRLGTSDNKYNKNQKEETEHVVHLAWPVREELLVYKNVFKILHLYIHPLRMFRSTRTVTYDTHQRELSMKNSCMNMQPNGKTPPITIPGISCV